MLSPARLLPGLSALVLALSMFCAAANAQNQAADGGGGSGDDGRPKLVRVGSYGAWELRCFDKTEEPRECMAQQLTKSNKKNLRGMITLVRAKGEFEVRFEVPISVYLPRGLALTIDGKDYGVIPYEICLPDRCVAFAVMKPETVAQMKGGKLLTVIFFSDAKTKQYLSVSLDQVASVFRALQ